MAFIGNPLPHFLQELPSPSLTCCREHLPQAPGSGCSESLCVEAAATCPREGATPYPPAPPGLGFPAPSSEGTKPVAFEVLTGPQCAVRLFLIHTHTHTHAGILQESFAALVTASPQLLPPQRLLYSQTGETGMRHPPTQGQGWRAGTQKSSWASRDHGVNSGSGQ